MHLLLVEDETDAAETLQKALSCLDKNYEISHAASLDSAVQLAEDNRFDAALVDLTLPDAQYCDIAHALSHAAPNMPIVALTGCGFEDVGLALARAGAQDYLHKGADSVSRIHQSLQLAIERQRQKQILRRLACYDDLTGAMSRRETLAQLEKAISHATRNRQLGAVMLIDIDNFKGINDIYGHQTGDAVLREIASRLIGSLRSGDSVGRLGGDEFVAIIEGLEASSQATQVGRKLLDRCCFSYAVNGKNVEVTASIGVAVFPADASSAMTLLRLADCAMYKAKRDGKASVNGAPSPER